MSPSSRGPGRGPLTAQTGVRIPVGTPVHRKPALSLNPSVSSLESRQGGYRCGYTLDNSSPGKYMPYMPSYLQIHKSKWDKSDPGEWRFRREVLPDDIKSVIGKKYWIAPLGTSNLKEADRLVKPHITR